MTVENSVKMVSPENGWAYMICVGFVITFSVCMAPTNSFGIVFASMLNNDGENIMPYITGICGFSIAISGPIANILLQWMSLRQLAVSGAALYTLSWFLHVFIPNGYYMILTYGVMNGFAWGIILITTYIVFDKYFVKKRVMMMGICMTIVGIGPIIMPYVIQHWMKNFGYRGTVALISAMCAHTLVGTALYQPVEWHLVPESMIELTEQKKLEIKDVEQNEPLMDKAEESTTTLWDKIVIASNIKLMKQFTYWNICLGVGVGLIGDVYFCIYLPTLLYEYNMPESEVASCVSIISQADLASRLILGILGKYFRIRSFPWFYSCLIITMIARLVFLQFTTFIGIASILVVYGFMRAWVYVFYPILFAEELPKENYGKAFALCSLFNFLFNFYFTSITGAAKSLTGSFVLPFYLIAISGLIAIIPWTIELFIVRPMKRKQAKNINI